MPTPRVAYLSSPIDHFSEPPPGQPAPTFKQKILTYEDLYQAGGPVLLYTGNEGPIEAFYENTGIVFEWAHQLGALVVFVEHRYYGESLPFGNASFAIENLRYLTIQQALEDFAQIVETLQEQYGMTGDKAVPWIAVGGSYGGMLSAWMRVRYPWLISGAIASSAPIKYLSPLVDYSYFAAATADYAERGVECVDAVRAGYKQLEQLVEAKQWTKIQYEWRLCSTPDESTIQHLRLWSINSLAALAQYDYPYEVCASTRANEAPLYLFTPARARSVTHLRPACSPSLSRSLPACPPFRLIFWPRSPASLSISRAIF